MMGGTAKNLAKGQELYDQGKYRNTQEIHNNLVYPGPGNQKAKDLLADCFGQIGYQRICPRVSNSFLVAAYELRSGILQRAPSKTAGPGNLGLSLHQSFGHSCDMCRLEKKERQ